MLEHIIPAGIAPMPLKSYLARAYPMLKVQKVFKGRDVKVNGARRGGEFLVRGGDEVCVYAALDMSISVAGQANGLLAVVKPQGLPVDRDALGIGEDTALSRARLIAPGAQLCHRLDAQTGGVLLLATRDEALSRALIMFKRHLVEKRYMAIVRGAFDEKQGVYRERLIKDAARATVKIVARGEGALPVETRWKRIGEIEGGLSRVELEPVTGRTHQLRAHMAYHGHPILGDDKYGDRELNRIWRTKLCLWCSALRIGDDFFGAEAPDWLGRG